MAVKSVGCRVNRLHDTAEWPKKRCSLTGLFNWFRHEGFRLNGLCSLPLFVGLNPFFFVCLCVLFLVACASVWVGEVYLRVGSVLCQGPGVCEIMQACLKCGQYDGRNSLDGQTHP